MNAREMLRIGAVSYLNTKPLVRTLEQGSSEFRLSFDLPSRLADQLQNGELDVALIPSVETFLQKDLTIVSDACIACCGPVWSVKLFSRVEPKLIGSLALDEGSRTSAALVKILLRQQYGIDPVCQPLPIDTHWENFETDSVMIIGDRAMRPPSASFVFRQDLGAWWQQLTGLPFVFAVWAARPGVDLAAVEDLLVASRDAGLNALHDIARTQAPKYQLTEQRCFEYLSTNLHFVLQEKERESLELFYQQAAAMMLVPQDRELVFHD